MRRTESPTLQFALVKPSALMKPLEELQPIPLSSGIDKFAIRVALAQPDQSRDLAFGEPFGPEVILRDSADSFVEYHRQSSIPLLAAGIGLPIQAPHDDRETCSASSLPGDPY
jgi:hypothetical protein